MTNPATSLTRVVDRQVAAPTIRHLSAFCVGCGTTPTVGLCGHEILCRNDAGENCVVCAEMAKKAPFCSGCGNRLT